MKQRTLSQGTQDNQPTKMARGGEGSYELDGRQPPLRPNFEGKSRAIVMGPRDEQVGAMSQSYGQLSSPQYVDEQVEAMGQNYGQLPPPHFGDAGNFGNPLQREILLITQRAYGGDSRYHQMVSQVPFLHTIRDLLTI